MTHLVLDRIERINIRLSTPVKTIEMKRENLAVATDTGKLDEGCVAAAFRPTYDGPVVDGEHPQRMAR